MGNLLLRRRALMQTGEVTPSSPLKYSLYNQNVALGDSINTGYAPFTSGRNATILFDMTVTSNPTSGSVSNNWWFLRCNNTAYNHSEFWLGKYSTWVTNLRTRWNASYTRDNLSGTKSAAGRQRIAVRHEANSNTILIDYRYNTATPLSFSLQCDAVNPNFQPTADTDYLYLGYGSGSSALPPGTINMVEIYNTILTDSEINDFLTTT